MKFRRLTALTALLTFIVMVVSSVILYIAPQGRIAYWANWTIAELDKEQWGAIHINTGTVFLLALFFHIYLNWKAIKTYLKTRTKQFTLFTKEFNVALLITLFSVVGTYIEIPPFSSMMVLNETIKENAAQYYGEPPYGHAELSTLQTYCKRMGLNLGKSIDTLRAAGLVIESGELQIKELAEINNMSPLQLLKPLHIKPKASSHKAGGFIKIPDGLSGVGRLTLENLNTQYGLNISATIEELKAKGVNIDDTSKIKQVAEQYSISPHDLLEMIKEAHNQSHQETQIK